MSRGLKQSSNDGKEDERHFLSRFVNGILHRALHIMHIVSSCQPCRECHDRQGMKDMKE